MTDRDDALSNRLRALAGQVDPPPAAVDQAARAALATRRLAEEYAALVRDSATDVPELVRGDGDEPRLLSFECRTTTVEVQVRYVGDVLALRGLVSGASGDAVLETPSGRRVVPLDGGGWFSVDGLPPGLYRFRLESDGPVTTGWVTL
ncbi:hypothetical protein [Micromonospora sp. WMMD1082]|uniref:hypothetical protein n=1 Tax=Micromonospora sp. WMMD1082 TaxID=3016104 RepID=UPI002417E504|nr:hypothetical protein [Micromonospora sp. WMMD1082]MDG4798153.1 hypothetical protein [Micromonospora sp. WMMD1082]